MYIVRAGITFQVSERVAVKCCQGTYVFSPTATYEVRSVSCRSGGVVVYDILYPGGLISVESNDFEASGILSNIKSASVPNLNPSKYSIEEVLDAGRLVGVESELLERMVELLGRLK